MRKRNCTMKEIDELEQTFKNTLREELWVSVYDLNEDILDLKELEVPTTYIKYVSWGVIFMYLDFQVHKWTSQ